MWNFRHYIYVHIWNLSIFYFNIIKTHVQDISKYNFKMLLNLHYGKKDTLIDNKPLHCLISKSCSFLNLEPSDVYC